MFLAPDGEEIGIADAAAEFLADALPIARLHAGAGPDLPPTKRRQLAEMGWFALSLPEIAGGSGLSAVEHALFFREVGRQCGPVDVLAQSLAVLVAEDQPAVRDGLIAGDKSAVLAFGSGESLRALGAPDADYALVADRSGARLVSLSGDADVRSSLDPANSMSVVTSEGIVAASRDGDLVWRMGELGTAAMLLGVAEAALDLIVDYAKIRETFGRKIGAYQAVRHPCADMALRAETARCQLWFAAAALKEDRSDAEVHLDAAKHLANQAAIANADSNIQLHGGIGVTDEHDAHLLLKHALLLGKIFGSKRPLLARLLHARADS